MVDSLSLLFLVFFEVFIVVLVKIDNVVILLIAFYIWDYFFVAWTFVQFDSAWKCYWVCCFVCFRWFLSGFVRRTVGWPDRSWTVPASPGIFPVRHYGPRFSPGCSLLPPQRSSIFESLTFQSRVSTNPTGTYTLSDHHYPPHPPIRY